MSAQVVTVGLLTAYIREVLEQDRLLADVWVEGEVSDLFQSRAGHVYFTLKDSESQLRCVLFHGLATRHRAQFRTGDQVVAHGRIGVYQRDGQYQLYADAVQPAGTGLLALQLELLRRQLEAEGLFDTSRKRSIPASPRYIGVVTSPDGSVWHDIQNVLRRRYPFVELILAPATVQGESAPASLVAALEALQDDGRADVIIVARGGGSTEDLWCFNDERVARAVFACRVPVVSGVGHETDRTLIDEVADLRAPTPSAAAELCSPSIAEIIEHLDDLRLRLRFSGNLTIRSLRRELGHRARSVERSAPRSLIDIFQSSTTSLRHTMSLATSRRLSDAKMTIRDHALRANRTQVGFLRERRLYLRVLDAKLAMLDPRSVLDRGYAVLISLPDGHPIHSSAGSAAGDPIAAHLRDGVIESIVNQVVPASQSIRNADGPS